MDKLFIEQNFTALCISNHITENSFTVLDVSNYININIYTMYNKYINWINCFAAETPSY